MGFTLLIGVIGGLLIAMRNRAPVIQVGERDVESRSLWSAVLFGFGVVFFVGFLYLMVPKDFQFPDIPLPKNDAKAIEEPRRATLGSDEIDATPPIQSELVMPITEDPLKATPPPVQPQVKNRLLVIIQTNAFGNIANAEREVSKLNKRYPACKVLIDGKLYHTGYGPFNTEAEAERLMRVEGLSGKIEVFYY